LYLAARAQLVDEVIRPAKNLGAIVIADRFSLSTLAYQSGGRRLPLKTVRAADDLARDGLRPDLTIVLGVTAAQQRARRHPSRRRDRIERETAPFFARVRRAYARFGKGGTRQLVIDSGIGANAVYNEALAAIDRLNKRARRR
jgi:dTMP kinase